MVTTASAGAPAASSCGGLTCSRCSALPYAQAAELLARYEIPDAWRPSKAHESALSYAMLGTVLLEPVILALRRLAHVSRTRQVVAQKGTAQATTPPQARSGPRTSAKRPTRAETARRKRRAKAENG